MPRRVLMALALLAPSPAMAADPIFGRWRTDDGAAIVRIAPCDGKLCGAIARVLDRKAPPNDINNPDRRQRTRPLAGVLVLRDFVHSGAEWKGGRAYDPKTGNSYTSELMVQQDGRLKVTGCILFLCRSRLWTRSD